MLRCSDYSQTIEDIGYTRQYTLYVSNSYWSQCKNRTLTDFKTKKLN